MSWISIIAVVVVILLLVPIKVMCGAPGKTCASAPNKDGKVSRYYVYEPLGIYILELLLRSDIEIHYLRRDEES